MKIKNTNKAFTLAEVLIALTIIGVVSALTIPTLIQRTNKQEYVSALQKAYSTLSQATNMIIAEEGSPYGSDDSWSDSAEKVYQLYKKHLNNVKDCGNNDGCFHAFKFLNTNRYDRNWGASSDSNSRAVILADGMQAVFTGKINGTARIVVDVNGEKAPNMWGRDAFMFVIRENGLEPSWCSGDYCPGTDPGNIGKGCACKVLREGAMNY